MTFKFFKGSTGPGLSCWPEHFDDAEIGVREKREGKSKFALQYMVRSGIADMIYPLRLEDLIIYDMERDTCPLKIDWSKTFGGGFAGHNPSSTCIEEMRHVGFSDDAFYAPTSISSATGPYAGTKMWVDPSGKGKDATGWAIVSQGFGKLFCPALGGFTGVGYSEHVLESISRLARQHGVNEISIEDAFGSGMFARLLEPILINHYCEPGENPLYPAGWRCSVLCGKETRLFGMKERRIVDTLEPIANSHRLVMSREAASNPDFQRQWTRIRAERACLDHDDVIESLAEACRSWSDVLRLDPEAQAQREHDRQIDQYMDDCRALAGARAKGGPSWFRHD